MDNSIPLIKQGKKNTRYQLKATTSKILGRDFHLWQAA